MYHENEMSGNNCKITGELIIIIMKNDNSNISMWYEKSKNTIGVSWLLC